MPHGMVGSVCSGLKAMKPLFFARVGQEPFILMEDERSFLGTIRLQDDNDSGWPKGLVGFVASRPNMCHP